ncbi:MAG: ATP-dependent helicase HrpB [Alphaproteobacteria bacterium]|nr:MAG: ATP-dependent helicase HrpB [Alphaproteobacteria bacterium]
MPGPPLPIDPLLPGIVARLTGAGVLVLQAPPGAGKTTRVPLALLPAIARGRIVMLEPRRVAARAAAEWLAEAFGERPGGVVGYRMRGETRVGEATRIEVVTEGVLTRMIQSDPELSGIACLIFDEIHERALQADLALALALEARAALRPDLMLMAMSATLDAGPLAELMGAEVLTAEGRNFTVEIRHAERPRGARRVEEATAELVRQALAETEGGILVFLPGEAEIRRVAQRLSGALPEGVRVQRLYGALSVAEQRAALRPVETGRKLVLATAIAETSLTIPDIRVVIDAGLARRSRHDPGSGMSRLVTERVSRAEAEQRAGRAGRVAPGVCYRLWTRGEHGGLAAHPPPEIAAADLAQLALELALWGARENELPFLTPPPEPALAAARELLRGLGALDAGGRITAHGKALATLPVHPRLGHMLMEGRRLGAGGLACEIVALLEDRDPMRGAGADLSARLNALRDPKSAPEPARAALHRIAEEARRLKRRFGGMDGTGEITAGGLLSLAYPDRIGLRRPGAAPRYLLSGGKGAVLAEDDALAGQRLIVAADLDGDRREARIRLALPVSEAEIRALHGARLERCDLCEWSRRERAVIARRRLMLGALVLEDRHWRDAPEDALAAAMAEGIRDLGLEILPWTPASRRLRARMARLAGRPGMPDVSDAALLARLDDWLGPDLAGFRRIEDLSGIDLAAALGRLLDWPARETLDRLAPEAIRAPTGTRLPIDWSGETPTVSVRLQEMFGLDRHPTVGPEDTPLAIELLSPAGRPVQITRDLPGFWATSYADVRKEMRGRYPRHPWPEDPAKAAPTRRAKPRT